MPRAVSLTEQIVRRFQPAYKQPHPIERIELIPGGGGVFDVWADGQLIYSKKETGRHATAEEVLGAISHELAKSS